MIHETRELRGIPLWLIKDYLAELGGVEQEPDFIQGAGWRIHLQQLDDFQVGSIRVGQVHLDLEADPGVYTALMEALDKKLLRAGDENKKTHRFMRCVFLLSKRSNPVINQPNGTR